MNTEANTTIETAYGTKHQIEVAEESGVDDRNLGESVGLLLGRHDCHLYRCGSTTSNNCLATAVSNGAPLNATHRASLLSR